VSRWRKGESTIDALLERGHLQRVTPGADTADSLVATSERHVESAAAITATDPEAALSLAYDAARKAATALLAHQGLRPTTAGGHLVVVEAVEAQFPGVGGLRSLDRLRRRRNQAEYPDPAGYDPITADEAAEAVECARSATTAARTLLATSRLGVF